MHLESHDLAPGTVNLVCEPWADLRARQLTAARRFGTRRLTDPVVEKGAPLRRVSKRGAVEAPDPTPATSQGRAFIRQSGIDDVALERLAARNGSEFDSRLECDHPG